MTGLTTRPERLEYVWLSGPYLARQHGIRYNAPALAGLHGSFLWGHIKQWVYRKNT